MTNGAVHQGFVLRVSEFAYAELDMILDKAAQEENPLILILDGLNDPHNFGSILRTADVTKRDRCYHSKTPCGWCYASCCQDINRCR